MFNLNIAVIPKTKKKLKDSKPLKNYTMSYSGKDLNKHINATKSIGIIVLMKEY
jgi:hypothetical protein